MLMFALALLAPPAQASSWTEAAVAVPVAMLVQAQPYSTVTSETYAAPVVRPYEPPSDLGRQAAEGDADATVRGRVIAAPVAVEAYSASYEASRSPRELSYQQGVEAARQTQNARMGPLDGEWRAVDAEGGAVLDLVLSDRGASWPIEGALRLARTDRTVLIDSVTTAGETRVVTAAVDGRPVELRLHRQGQDQGQSWRGELAGLGRAQSLTLVRPEGWSP